MKAKVSAYEEGHVFVAAIRILSNRRQRPPTLEAVCQLLQQSIEWGHAVCRKLEKNGSVKVLKTPFDICLAVDNHLNLEQLSKTEETSALDLQLAAFKQNKQDVERKVAGIEADLARKRKAMFAQLEEKLQEEKIKKDR